MVYETQSDLAAQSINAASILSLNQENYSEVYKGARSLDTVVAPTIQWLMMFLIPLVGRKYLSLGSLR